MPRLSPVHGVPEAVDIIRVRHVSGGVSTIGFKAYSDLRAKFQGETLNWVYLDEEPPPDIYSECLTRTNTTSGSVWITATPCWECLTLCSGFSFNRLRIALTST